MSTEATTSGGGAGASRAPNRAHAADEPTGCGPRQVPITAMHGRGLPPKFDGDEARYHIWEARFLAYLKTIGLRDAILGTGLAAGANAEEAVEVGRKNELAYAELCGCLDDKTLTLILYEAPDDGKKSLEILRCKFESEEKPRIVGLYTELTNVLMADGEDLADYLARVEKIVAALHRAKETLSDALLMAMVLKGLTDEYNPFLVHATQTGEVLTFTEFKARLRSFECTLRYRNRPRADEVMTANYKTSKPKFKGVEKKYFNGECFICEKVGHKAKDCRNRDKKTHRRAPNAQSANKVAAITDTGQGFSRAREKHRPSKEEEELSFVLRVSEWKPHGTPQQGLLVYSGASAHIMTDEGAFIRFDDTFRPKDHVMQLVDGTHNNKMILPDGTTCKIKVKDRVYFLDTVTENDVNSEDSCNASFDLKTWHEVMGHCNYGDIVKLEGVVDGMKIKDKTCRPNQCETCLQGKFSQSRNRQSDVRAKEPLELVHTL